MAGRHMTIKIDLREFTIDYLCKQDTELSDRCTSATRGPTTGGPAPWTGVMRYEVQYRL